MGLAFSWLLMETNFLRIRLVTSKIPEDYPEPDFPEDNATPEEWDFYEDEMRELEYKRKEAV
jgi:hypothetical protein